ncbi:MAG: helix-turn-helix transcriptional regulator [Planctomycetota bacterium]|jgi:hypothetical protein
MRLFNLFRKKRKRRIRHRQIDTGTRRQKHRDLFERDIKLIKSELEVINIILRRHDQDINENSLLLEKHSQRLEQLVEKEPASHTSVPISPSSRPNSTTMPVQSIGAETQKFDINMFSNQEKRILAAFFEHQGMALSYRDIAQMLNKSPNTVKNQMHQINLKTDLFKRTVDPDQRNRFRLKDGLKIEKYLTNRPD